jgi:quercetin dioxygenase-like cupin family protein
MVWMTMSYNHPHRYLRAFCEEYKAQKIQVAQVKFAPGARNKFHTHSNGQILYVTEGKGIVATENREYIVTPGTLIFISPNEVHRHGATKESEFSHIYISRLGSKLTQLED